MGPASRVLKLVCPSASLNNLGQWGFGQFRALGLSRVGSPAFFVEVSISGQDCRSRLSVKIVIVFVFFVPLFLILVASLLQAGFKKARSQEAKALRRLQLLQKGLVRGSWPHKKQPHTACFFQLFYSHKITRHFKNKKIEGNTIISQF